MKLTRFDKLQKENASRTLKPLIDSLAAESLDESAFVAELDSLREWNRGRDDLFTWIPVLNRVDDILTRIIANYGYKAEDHKSHAVELKLMVPLDVEVVGKLLDFSCRLLYNTENRFIYSSLDVMNNLLNCPNFIIKAKAMKILAVMGERNVVTRERIGPDNVLYNGNLKKRTLKLALALPSSMMLENGEHFSLTDIFVEKRDIPAKWSKLRYSYYSTNSELQPGPHNNKIMSHATTNHKTDYKQTPIKRFCLSTEDLRSLTLQEIFDRGMQVLPRDAWFDFSLQATISKAFCENSPENLALRDSIISTKLNAISFANTVFAPPQVSSKLFEIDPYVFNMLSEFVFITENKAPKNLRLDAIFALECISLKHVWCSDIMRNLGGNMSHGMLFQVLKFISKIMRDNSDEVDEEYNVRFFYLISNIADVKSLHESLLAAGLIPTLLDIVSIKNSRFKRSLASAIHLLESFINGSEAASEFINNDGFNILINLLTEEVKFALSNPSEGPSKYSLAKYGLTFRQVSYFRSLLKLVIKLLNTDSGDRIRNLIDSPILDSILKILQNKAIFGTALITLALDVTQRVINCEPTIYSILVEAGIVPYIFNNFGNLLDPSWELIALVPDLLSALCLNQEGLKEVEEKRLVRYLFSIIIDQEYAQILSWAEEAAEFGTAIDELARHYPTLRDSIVEEFNYVLEQIPRHVNFSQPFLYEPNEGNDYFYHSKHETVLEYEENQGELAFWDVQHSSFIIDCFSNILYGMTLENSNLDEFFSKVSFDDLFRVIIVERPPFDYVYSQTMLNFTDVLQIFDDEYKSRAFEKLMSDLNEKFLFLSRFLDSDPSKSYFLGLKPGDDNSYADATIAHLSQLSSIMFILTSVFVNHHAFDRSRTKQIVSFFEKNGYGLLKNLRVLFHRCALEEQYFRYNMPDKVITDTMPESMGNKPPIQIHISKPSGEQPKDDKTSAKFKNTFQLRGIFSRIQCQVSILFRQFLGLSNISSSTTLEKNERIVEVKILETIIDNILEMMNNVVLRDNLPFLLVILHFNTFIFSYSKTNLATTDMLKTIPVYLFLQKGGYETYSAVITKLFKMLSQMEDLSTVEHIDYVKDTKEVLVLSSLINSLSFFNKSMTTDTLENFYSLARYYPELDQHTNISKNLTLPVKTMALKLISSLDKENLLFDPTSKPVPSAVFKQILSMLKNAFAENHDDMEPLYLLSSDNISSDFDKSAHDHDIEAKEVNTVIFPYSTPHELEEARSYFVKINFSEKVFNVLPYYPKLVNAFAKTLIQILRSVQQSPEKFTSTILDKVLRINIDDEASLSSLIHLFGIFLNEKNIYRNSTSLIIEVLNYLVGILTPDKVNTSWFSKALYVYEIILTKSEIPMHEDIRSDVKVDHSLLMEPKDVFRIPADLKRSVFDVLIRLGDITSFYSALATSRILIFYASDESYSAEVTRSGILSKLLKVIGLHQKLDKINFLESSFLLLVRRCFETDDVVTDLIKNEIERAFSTSMAGSNNKTRELYSLLEEKTHVAIRSPRKFVDVLHEKTRFEEFDSKGELIGLRMHYCKAEEQENCAEIDKKVSTRRTGIVHLLLSQLMAAYEKDWVGEPLGADENDSTNSKKSKAVKADKNPVCAYMMFLLKMLIELITSYKQCKLEFLTFNRRNTYAEVPKPRTTAINFFLYQLLDPTPSNEQNIYEKKRKSVISALARSVLVGFATSLQGISIKKPDVKLVDPDISYIRKFIFDALTKAIKLSTFSGKKLETTVTKLNTWFKLIASLVYVQAPYLRLLHDSNRFDADQYQLCKIALDLDVPNVITDFLATVDLNYPFAKSLFNDALEALNGISSARSNFAELFKVDEDDDIEVESDKEETHDMFKNSALGMYDVEDIEEDDDDDDEGSLIGDDYDIAFVDNDEAYEVVFSDESMDGLNHSDSGFTDEGDYDDRVDYPIDSEGITVEIESISEGSYSDAEQLSESDDMDDSYMEEEHASIVEEETAHSYSSTGLEGGSDDDDQEDSPEELFSGGEIDFFDINQSDWESGLSELSESDDEHGRGHVVIHGPRRSNTTRRWILGDGASLTDEESEDDERGVFQGIEHTFTPEEPIIFGLADELDNHRRQGYSHRNARNMARHGFGIPSLSLFNNNQRNQSNLINPLGPTGLEQMENDIADQLTRVGNGIMRPGLENATVADVLFGSDFMDERPIDGIVMKPSVARWKDIFDMFYDSKEYVDILVSEIINSLYHMSLEEYKKGQESVEKRNTDRKQKRIEKKKRRLSEADVDTRLDDEVTNHETESVVPIERSPIYVSIDGTDVDIAGTDIDPEFLLALPEEMRGEVFAQHVQERRAEARQNHTRPREVDSDFLDALPDELREEILEQENSSTLFIGTGETSDEEDDEHGVVEIIENANVGEGTIDNSEDENTKSAAKKKSNRVYFSPLVDRAGIAALLKSIFISQPYMQREGYHELFYRLCASKQNRNDIINMLLIILTESVIDQQSFDKVYGLVSTRATGTKTPINTNKHLPLDCTPLTITNQAIEILHSLIDADSRVKYFFITEHDNKIPGKPSVQIKKDLYHKIQKWPIKYLFMLLDRKIIMDETVLMDLLTHILQVCTRPIDVILNPPTDSKVSKRKFSIPDIDKDDMKKLIGVINSDNCNTKVFQQTLNVIHNLLRLKDAKETFITELITLASTTVKDLSKDLEVLSKESAEFSTNSDISSELIQKFTVPSSEQSKLLKVLTTVDFIFTHKKQKDEIVVDQLMDVYNRMNLGIIWSHLSSCLLTFEKSENLNTSATILLPLIESLMVVCKQSKVNHGVNKTFFDFGSDKKLDITNVPVENLFFSFTDYHKKLLNQMIRSNPKLMTGPFSLLVKNPRILDFDNKRYYFIAQLRVSSQERPKLPITVTRDQVFLDSYRALFFKTNEEIKHSKLEITFKNESGVDAGGVTREWYQVLSRQIFNPDYALFLPVASDKTTFHPNRTSGVNPEHLSFFKFIGMIIGKAIRDQCFLDCHFSRDVYKNILGKPVSLKDMESLDLDYYKSLMWILENDITDVIEETFSVETDDYGEHKLIDLVENGRNILVTEENKHDYVKRIVEYKLYTSVKEQMDNFLVGFYALIPKDMITIFDEQELELLISGLPDIDVDDWRNNTTYVNYTPSCKQVNYFWRAVKSFDAEERAKLLQFVTGTSKVPLNGFKELSSVNGVCKFSIHKDYGSTNRLPSSHTCFNQLNLPAYNSYEGLRKAVLLAISEGHEGFGLA